MLFRVSIVFVVYYLLILLFGVFVYHPGVGDAVVVLFGFVAVATLLIGIFGAFDIGDFWTLDLYNPLPYVPAWTKWFLLFAFINLIFVLSFSSVPELDGVAKMKSVGDYYLDYHGDFVRSLSESEYCRMRNAEYIFFQSFSLFFFGLGQLLWKVDKKDLLS